jgi:predicted amidohydrolase
LSNTLNIALIQEAITWHQAKVNFERFSNAVGQVQGADLIVLPEMWSSGFTMKAEAHYKYSKEALDLMISWSLAQKAAIAGSLIVKEDGDFYNRLYFVEQGKVKCYYDKKHLFGFAGEDRFFKSGIKRQIVELKGWRILLNICYDLRFPVWCRNLDDYDVALFSANWPSQRIAAWDTLLRARAIENQAYVIAVNCLGRDAWKNNYTGHSAIIAYDGEILDWKADESALLRQALQKDALQEFRTRLPFLKDRDHFELKDSKT